MDRCKMTPEQRLCVDARDCSLVVSAAAGSGKTSVLVERVIDIICDEKHPVSADSIIVVTFTDAAAKEMKQRIKDEMTKRLEENPENMYLQEQSFLLSSAQISTMHSFCMNLLRNEYHRFGLKAGFTISNDDGTTAIMRRQAISDTLEEYYENHIDKINELLGFFDSSSKEIGFIEIVEQLDDFLQSLPFPKTWMQNQLDWYSKSKKQFESDNVKEMLLLSRSKLNASLKSIRRNCKRFRKLMVYEDEKAREKYIPMIELYEAEQQKRKSISLAFNNIRKLEMPEKVPTKKFIKSDCAFADEESAIKNDITSAFKAYDETLKELISSLKNVDEDKKIVYKILTYLFEFYDSYVEHYRQLKAEENVVTFDDLMRFTFDLLCDKNGNKTEFEKRLSNQYNYIILDEFQDTDDLQDKIFSYISRDETNLFIVGDTKQSIYRFRRANPDILINRKEYAKPYSNSADKWKKIFLNKNFRSRKGIIDFANFVFEGIMKKQIGGIEYNAEEMLSFGADYYPETVNQSVELCYIDTQKVGENCPDVDELEPTFVAQRIYSLIKNEYPVSDGKGSTRPCTYSDIAVVLRRGKYADSYINALENAGIPYRFNESRGYFVKTEIATMINLLSIIDNPLRELETVAVMMSPMFMFTAEEVAEIRSDNKRKNFHTLLIESEDEKVKEFTRQIDEFREYKASHCLEALVKKIYADTAFVSIVKALDGGEQRAANLNTFLSNVKSYESKSTGGLSEYLRLIKRISERAKTDDNDNATLYSSTDDCVKVMTIHKSKGLEFPICIVADVSSPYNIKDFTTKQMILNTNSGIGLKVRNPDALEYYSSLPYRILAKKESIAMHGEEIRLLYVAMTRAKERLIVVQSLSTADFTKYDASFDNDDILEAKSDLDLMLMALSRSKPVSRIMESYYDGALVSADEILDNLRFRIITHIDTHLSDETSEKEYKSVANDEAVSKIIASVNAEYKNQPLTALPSKVSVTELVHGENVGMMIFNEPSFMSEGKLNGAQIGTAHHKFMQYADFTKDVRSEISRLEIENKLTHEEAECLNVAKLEKAVKTSVIKRMIKSDKVWREYEFMSEISANEYDATIKQEFENVKISIQGVADCIFDEPDGLVLVDYKTDRVNTTAELADKYRKQLMLYTQPIETALKKKVKERIILSISLGEEIKV